MKKKLHPSEALINKFKSHTAIIGVIGLGYVGLPLGLAFASKGFNVIGFDIDEKKIPLLNSGKSYIKHIPASGIRTAVSGKKFKATSDFSFLTDCDAVIICVPTPLNEHREPDMSYIVSTAETVAKYLRKGQLVTLESTTYPGTTEEILLPLFENASFNNQSAGAVTDSHSLQTKNDLMTTNDKLNSSKNRSSINSKLKVGKDFFLAFSPEREDPNNPDYSTTTIPKVVGGVTKTCTEVACELYNQAIIQSIPVSSPKTAEATKLLENIYRSVNIALVNELKVVFERMGIDIWEVIEAAKTKPFGYNAFYPGPGLGGHCISIDPFYLSWKAREYDINTKFIELAGEINTNMPYYVIEKSIEALNKHKKSINGSKVLILGASYKKNIDDMRESPSLKLIEILREKGAEVYYHDPYVPELPKSRHYNFKMKSVKLTSKNLASYDLILLSTDHDEFDYKFIYKHSKLIVDSRNALKIQGLSNGKVFKA
ncbi:MAG: nucleotide sugar dehydrogenase [Bacteroidetes bacterium]|nr:nucleotide sugar dehydrogenase [Bacteroidota bacterium]